jgi:enterochelin esterase-like enzyme
VSDVFARFLETELLPLVSAEYSISDDPQLRMAPYGAANL